MDSVLVNPQTVQVKVLIPSSVSVAALVTFPESQVCCVCPSFGITSVLVLPQTVHVYVMMPVSVSVAALVTLPESQVCPLAATCMAFTVVCVVPAESLNTLSHPEQVQ